MPDVDRPVPISQAQAAGNAVQELVGILETWAAGRGQALDPVPILTSLCEIVERETELYLKMDPDPFDDRHPFRINPNSAFGSLLKALFRNDEFMDTLVHFYISARDSPKLNELACRLLYDILPGLEGSIVFTETEGIVTKLYKWAEEGQNPLKSYAIGLLAAAMGVQDIAVNYREKNARLMPLLLDELHELSNLPDELPPELKKYTVERPFASLNGLSDSKESIESMDSTFPSNGTSSNNNVTSENEPQAPNSRKRKKSSPLPSSKRIMLTPSRSPIRVAPLAELSNSSWAEKEFLTIGHYQIYPLSTNMRQRFILQYLTPLGDYQEFLPLVLEKNVLQLILHYINLKENRDVRLAFEALRYLASLLCHKKFTMEFLKANGVSRLLQVHRPSVAATGVSICLYYLGYSEDAMEKLCQLPPEVLTELIKYSLWLLERSHESSRCHAIMFLGMAFTYPKFLEYFDREEGLRWVVNVVSTLDIITNPDIYFALPEFENEDKVFTCMQTARHVCFTLKKYFEAHLVLKAEQLRQTNSVRSEENARSFPTKQLKWKQEEIEEALDFVLVNLPTRIKWHAVDYFIKLGGPQLMLKLLLIALDDSEHVAGKSEMVRSALEVLSVCTLVPKTQLLLTESVEHPNPDLDQDRERPQEIIGMSIVLSNIDNAPTEAADTQKAALHIIHNCVGGPRRHEKPHQNNNVASTSTGAGSAKKSAKSGDGDVLHRMWKCLRSHNGIMILLSRLSVKVPITEADSIRALACKALCGLARCSTVKQIISKLPLFTRGELEVLTREPILYDSSAYHVRFCQYANNLAQLVTGNALPSKNELRQIRARNDVSLTASPTEIKYKPTDLLLLMYEHMLGAGLTESAQALLKEGKLQDALSGKRNHWRRMAIRDDPRKALTPSTNSPHVFGAPITPQSKTIPLNRPRDLTASPVTMGRRQLKSTSFIEKSDQRDVLSPVVRKNEYNANILSLDGIVREYLGQQHSCCNVPVATCPPFDLLSPHRCEEPILKSFAPQNLTSRVLRRQFDFPWGGRHGAKQTRKYIYSRFKPIRTFREADIAGNYSCCAFSSCNEMLFVGTLAGDLKVFNLVTGADEASYTCHDTELTHCQPSKEGTLILTSSFFRQPTSVLWTFTDLFQQQMTFQEDTYVEFGKLSDERILGTQYGTARLYDTNTGRKLATFFDQKLANQYVKNRATLNPTDELVLNDGVLWDVRRAQPLHKFDKFNPYLNGVFTPNGLEVISNTEVWDLRTYKLLHTIPALNRCNVLFNSRGDVIYGAMVMCEDMDQERDEQLQSMYGSSFKTIDATDYSNIATIDIKRGIFDIKADKRDAYLAIIENAGERGNLSTESVVRLYEVGRQKLEGDVEDNEQEDDEEIDDDDDDDDADSNSSTELLEDSLDDEEDSASSSSGSSASSNNNNMGNRAAPLMRFDPDPPRGDDGDDDDNDDDDDDEESDIVDRGSPVYRGRSYQGYDWQRSFGSDSEVDDDGSLFQVNSASGGRGNLPR